MKRYLVASSIVMMSFALTATDKVQSHSANIFQVEDKTLADAAFAPVSTSTENALVLAAPPTEEVVQPKWKPTEKYRRAKSQLQAMLFGECRGQGRECMILVGNVAMNRARENLDARYGKGLWGVLNKRKAFSCFNKNDPNLKVIKTAQKGKLKEGSADAVQWEVAGEVAHFLMHRGGEDPSMGSTHYYAHGIVKPRWISDRGMKKMVVASGHTFYKKEG